MDSSFTSLFSFDITSYVKEVTYNKGEAIFRPGDDSSSLIYIRSGYSRISYIYPDGGTQELDYAPSPLFYGELEMLGVQKYTSSVEAVTECEAYIIDIERCRELLLSDAVFLRNLALFISLKLFRMNKRMAENLNYSLKKRLASYILKNEEGGIYSRSHKDTALYFSSSYRHLLSIFRLLEDDGAIVREKRGRYRIVDRAKLIEVVENE